MSDLSLSLSLSASAFTLLRDMIHARTGVFYENGKRGLLADKLAPLVAERGFDTFLDYYYLLKYDEQAAEEWPRVESALAVNETYFWREPAQIVAAAEILTPQLQRERPGQPVRIWHAGCASGEEPYSMVMALEAAGRYLRGPIEILATDANRRALAWARAGLYRKRSFRALPAKMATRYFSPAEKRQRQLRMDVRARVKFAYLNLMDAGAMRRMRNFDVIFCRNVFIYFSEDAIRAVTEHFYRALNPGGHLFIAAAESLLRLNTPFELVEVGGAFAYRKEDIGY